MGQGNGPVFRTRQPAQLDQTLHNGWVGGGPRLDAGIRGLLRIIP